MVVTVSSLPLVVAFPPANVGSGSEHHRCTFTRRRAQWTLQADCEISAPLDLPSLVTLDGDGHTITLVGDAEGYASAAIRTTGGDIVNLTVDGTKLLPLAPAYFAAIAFAAPGRIAHTTVRNIQLGEAPHSAIGIEVAAFDGATAVLQDIRLENISGAGLLLTGDSQVAAERVSVAGVTAAMQVNGGVTARLGHAMVEHTAVGVLAQDQSCVRIAASTVTGVRLAEDRARIHQDTLTFIGGRAREQAGRRATDAAATPTDLLG